jgi:hypothetical protein
MLRATHQLRRSVVVCRNCPLQEKCSQRAAFNAEIDALIADIDEQWQSSEEMCEFQRRFSKSTESGYSKDG